MWQYVEKQKQRIHLPTNFSIRRSKRIYLCVLKRDLRYYFPFAHEKQTPKNHIFYVFLV